MNMRMLNIKGEWPERIGLVLLAAAFFWGASSIIAYMALDKRAPLSPDVPLSITVVTDPPITEGTDIEVLFTREKVRSDCEVFALRKAIDDQGRSFDLHSTQWGGLPTGKSATLTYETGVLRAGAYTLDISVRFLCPGDMQFFFQYPITPFRIEPPGYVPPEVEQKTLLEQLSSEVDNLQRQLNEISVPEMVE